RIDDGREGGDGAGLAATLDAERVGRAARAVEAEIIRRKIIGARYCVIHERAGNELAGTRIIDRVFEEGLADALGDRAVHPGRGDHRVDQDAVIIDRSVAGERDLPRVAVDLDL